MVWPDGFRQQMTIKPTDIHIIFFEWKFARFLSVNLLHFCYSGLPVFIENVENEIKLQACGCLFGPLRVCSGM